MGWKAHPLNPCLDPALTPRSRKGPKPKCTCDKHKCKVCRRAASKRRWYQRNREDRQKVSRDRARAMRVNSVDNGAWDDLDRKAFEMLRQEGFR
jgi:hypothetical protein